MWKERSTKIKNINALTVSIDERDRTVAEELDLVGEGELHFQNSFGEKVWVDGETPGGSRGRELLGIFEKLLKFLGTGADVVSTPVLGSAAQVLLCPFLVVNEFTEPLQPHRTVVAVLAYE